jgi:hypothetical protein
MQLDLQKVILVKYTLVCANCIELLMYKVSPQSERRDLNPRPPLPQSGALPSCATPRSQLSYYNQKNSNEQGLNLALTVQLGIFIC